MIPAKDYMVSQVLCTWQLGLKYAKEIKKLNVMRRAPGIVLLVKGEGWRGIHGESDDRGVWPGRLLL